VHTARARAPYTHTHTRAQGTPTAYVQSGGVRRFCGSCGTPLSFARGDLPDELDVALAAFDNPQLWDVEMSIWTDHKARAARCACASPAFAVMWRARIE
jgi:hypothetical protein